MSGGQDDLRHQISEFASHHSHMGRTSQLIDLPALAAGGSGAHSVHTEHTDELSLLVGSASVSSQLRCLQDSSRSNALFPFELSRR